MRKIPPALWLVTMIAACGDPAASPPADLAVDASSDLGGVDLGRAPDRAAPDRGPKPDAAPPCPDWRCTSDCGALIQMPGATKMADGVKVGYYLSGGEGSQYRHFIRRDVAMLVVFASCEVKRKYPGVPPLGLTDMSEKDGSIPGTSIGKPAHPDGTHTGGHDMDVAYYQTDGINEPQIVCGDGSDTNYNGQPGKYNDGYFCTTAANIVDWEKQVHFLAKIFESDQPRVFGVDQMLVKDLGAEVSKQYKAGAMSEKVYKDFNSKMAWGASGGWQFHHHHIHMSFK
jgi:hypothetical protein